MTTYEGIYTCDSPDNAQKCLVTVTNKRIEIHLRDADGNPRVVYWYWYNVAQGDRGLQYTGLPLQTLAVASPAFHEAAAKKMKRPQPRIPAVVAVFAGAVLLVAALAAVAYFWLIPFLAGRMVRTIPVAYEVKFGEEAYNAMIKAYKVLPQQTALVNSFYRELHIPSRYPVKITVVAQPQTSAFAVPGGHIVVFSGLLQQMRRPEELAALLAHEFSHIELRHTTRSLLQSLGTYMVVSLVFGDVTGIGAVVVENAHTLKNLEYSRKLEKEADLNGLQLLHARQISGQGYIWLFGTLKKESAKGRSEWLSSHPDLDNRIDYIQAALKGDTTATVPAALMVTWQQIKADH